ncbi:hypothetical protein C6B36_08600 [Helicobacter cinaedi]|uniref:hypothetical protein n=1 Tax=Helicobacter cinaedi TaxID=213 RepID=UPI000CF0EA4C|nr:hypothetical protein [Helicobacter cinaedi]AWK62386.1 hypothetical protein C6B36_08600 [Helicobacter cinaedi]QOQ96977.1 hypothetical protein HW245_04915 [Helicobacter cinaedi]
MDLKQQNLPIKIHKYKKKHSLRFRKKKKGLSPPVRNRVAHPLAQKSLRFLPLRDLQSYIGNQGGVPRYSASSIKSAAGHFCPPLTILCTTK